MSALLRVIYERRRLWPPDNSSFVACVGLLGWLPFAYVPPSQAVEKLMDWMWLSGLHDIQPRQRGSVGAFRVGDQQAIDAYAIGITEGIFTTDRLVSVQWLNKSGFSVWERDELISLQTLGRRHGTLLGNLVIENGRAIRSRLESAGYIEQIFDHHLESSFKGANLNIGDVGQLNGGGGGEVMFSKKNTKKKVGWKIKSELQKQASSVRRGSRTEISAAGDCGEFSKN